MNTNNRLDGPGQFFRNQPGYAPTPLLDLPRLAKSTGTERVYVKEEGRRWLGSFKSLGGTYAGLRALVRFTGSAGIEELLSEKFGRSLPRLLCASDGNHGLAVAAAGRLAGAPARVFLHQHVSPARARRIQEQGAEIVWVSGTYDDAVDEAVRSARQGEGLLIADTATDPEDLIVSDVLAGYEFLAEELLDQFATFGWPYPTHLFVQAGVGGLAAALARGLAPVGCRAIVVEPRKVACVGASLRSGRIDRLAGDLQTAAEMLSCGEASAPALKVLQEHGAQAIMVEEEFLVQAPRVLVEVGGPATTPSGAAGLAGLLATKSASVGLNRESRVLLIATEGPGEEGD